jgi:hypothetical protein
MAVKGSGVVAKTIDPVMQNRESTSPIDPRSGAAKRTQTKFPVKQGMTDMVKGSVSSFAGPKNPGVGPDADPANPLSPEPKDKDLRRQPRVLKSSWDMKDANGQGVDGTMGQAVLDEASRLGAPFKG